MKSDFTYDLLIIGGGISACVFASKYLQNNITKKIALIEIGRGLGGRSSTRISKKFKGWKLNHGAPNLNICNSTNNSLLQSYICLLWKKISHSLAIFERPRFKSRNPTPLSNSWATDYILISFYSALRNRIATPPLTHGRFEPILKMVWNLLVNRISFISSSEGKQSNSIN